MDTENTLHLTTGQDQLEVTEQMVQVHNTQNTENVMAAQESQVVNFFFVNYCNCPIIGLRIQQIYIYDMINFIA